MSKIIIDAKSADRLVAYENARTIEFGSEPLVSVGVYDYVVIFKWNGKQTMIKASGHTNIDALIPAAMLESDAVEFSVIAGPGGAEGKGPNMSSLRVNPNFKQVEAQVTKIKRYPNSETIASTVDVVSSVDGLYVIENN